MSPSRPSRSTPACSGRAAPFWCNPGVAVIEFLPPIPPWLKSKEFFQQLVTEIETATNRLIDEALGARPVAGAAGRRQTPRARRPER